MLRWSVKEREERELHAGMVSEGDRGEREETEEREEGELHAGLVSEGVRPWSVIRT